VLIESVGVGQSETEVDSVCDCVLLVLPPAGGDELQAMKKGIMEVADLVVVNKADGNLKQNAKLAAAQIKSSLQFVSRKCALRPGLSGAHLTCLSRGWDCGRGTGAGTTTVRDLPGLISALSDP
jgi:LAO/AO transport system kinase